MSVITDRNSRKNFEFIFSVFYFFYTNVFLKLFFFLNSIFYFFSYNFLSHYTTLNLNNKICLAFGWRRFFVIGLKRAIWPSVGNGSKYGHVLLIKILIS